MSIFPLPVPLWEPGIEAPDVTALFYVLTETEPDLWARGLPEGESFADAAARRAAALDIADDLLAEFAAEIGGAR